MSRSRPTTAGSTGGEPGGNIRNGYLYQSDRVTLVEGSLGLINDAAFNGSRKPLVATWSFNDQEFTTVNVHFTSRLGSDPLWGDAQPPRDGGDASRTAQAAAVGDYVFDILSADASRSSSCSATGTASTSRRRRRS
jgi:predicted extracellular nuclease